jgi:hypothetical protein
MTVLSRHGRRRIGLGWMATTMITSPGAAPRGMARAAASFSTETGHPYQAIKELANRVQQTEPARAAPRVENSGGSVSAESKSEEKRLQSELAREICQTYQSLPSLKLPLSESCERAQILMFLSSECSPTDSAVSKTVDHFIEKRDTQAWSLSKRLQAIAVSNLRKTSTPAYEEILEYILKQDAINGMQFLVALREDILRAIHWIRSSSKDDERFPHLDDLDAYLLRLFSLWFSPGMLGEWEITIQSVVSSHVGLSGLGSYPCHVSSFETNNLRRDTRFGD